MIEAFEPYLVYKWGTFEHVFFGVFDVGATDILNNFFVTCRIKHSLLLRARRLKRSAK